MGFRGSSNSSETHLIFIPFMAQGHLIPMVDMARLFARRSVAVTLITTPSNAARFHSLLSQDPPSYFPLRLLQIPFPSNQVGLPESCESLDALHSSDMAPAFFQAISLLQHPVEELLREVSPPPTCIVSDVCVPWTADTARKLDVPRLAFHGTSCFYLLCSHNIRLFKPHEAAASDEEPFLIPGLPRKMEITGAQLPDSLHGRSKLHETMRKMWTAEAEGEVVNSFDALEPEYIESYRKVKGRRKIWTLGPVSLINKNVSDKMQRGNQSSIGEKICIEWLDSKKPNSVVYACFGSLCRLTPENLIEIGIGLEASGHDFIWVIRNCEKFSKMDKWLEEERFEERVKGRGLVIRGWAPQVLILSHPSTAAFFTHCGWNSTLEGVVSGLPMVTLPLFAEQFFNEKMVVDVWRVGVKLGGEVAMRWGEEEKLGRVMEREKVSESVKKVMEVGEEGEARRERARQLGIKAKKSMEEGGSSHLNMTLLLEDIIHFKDKVTP